MSSYNYSAIKTPPSLFTKVMARLQAEQRLAVIRRRFVLAGFLLVSAAALAVPTWQSFQANVQQSGFGQYLWLAYTDFQLVLAYWQDFGLSLLESMPTISLVELLSIVFVMVLSLKTLAKYGRWLLLNNSSLVLTIK